MWDAMPYSKNQDENVAIPRKQDRIAFQPDLRI